MKIGKKVAIGLIAVIAILMMNTKVQAAQVKITTDTLKLRKEPNTTSSVLALLSMDEVFEVIEVNGDWYKIRAKDQVGYVKKDYVKLEGEVSEAKLENEPEQQPEEEPEKEIPNSVESIPEETIHSEKKKIKGETDLRSLPLFSAISIEKLKKDDEIIVITEKNHWAYVQTETQSGWIVVNQLGEDVKEEQPASSNDLDSSTTTQQQEKIGYINSENVNFREKDSTSSNVIKKLKLNTELKILSETDKWCKVEVDGKIGYVSKDYVSSAKKEVTSRSLETERQLEEKVTETETKPEEEILQVEEVEEHSEEKTITSSSKGEEIVSLAKTFLGNQYVYAAEGPKNFDCSGFTLYLYKQYGVTLPHSAATQIKQGTAVEKSELRAGDAVFFQDQAKTKVGHVGIYMGDGNFIHSSSAVGEVTITSLSKTYYATRFVGARRYLD